MTIKEKLKKALDELNYFKKNEKTKYNFHSFDNLRKYEFDFLFTVGTRSNGKSTSIQRDVILKDFIKYGTQFVKLCRYKDDLKNIHQSEWWTEVNMKILNKHDINIVYRSGKYYINEYKKYVENGEFKINEFIKQGIIIGQVIPIMRQQNYKSINYEKVTNIIFDEFALNNEYGYALDEVENFKSLLSTIVRIREDVKVFFIGNVLTPYNPYFSMFNINAMHLKEGKIYTHIDTSTYNDPCVVLVEFTKSVTSKIEDIPRLLRLPKNEQVTGMESYEVPKEIVNFNDWLVIALSDEEVFKEHYYFGYMFKMSIDDTKELKKNGDNYIFEYVEFVSIHDIFNDKIYLIRTNVDKNEHGLYINVNEDLPTYKIFDEDIRNHLPIFDISKFKNKEIVIGDVELYRLFKEKGVKI